MPELGIIEPADLEAFFQDEPAAAFVIEGVVKSADARYLGQVALHDRDAVFRIGYWGELSDTARFRTIPMHEAEVGFDGVAIVFRQFERSRFKDHPVEYLAGWVPPAMAERAEQWVAEFNAHLQALLEKKRGAAQAP